jgi:hypothetical protein
MWTTLDQDNCVVATSELACSGRTTGTTADDNDDLA